MDTDTKETAAGAPKRLLTLSQFDSKAASEAGIVVELDEIGLDDDGVPYSITVLGIDAERVVTKEKKTLDATLRRIRKNQDLGGADESEQQIIDKLAAATIAWHLPPLEAGAPVLECTERNARILYSDPRFRWILRKVSKEQAGESRFFSRRSPS